MELIKLSKAGEREFLDHHAEVRAEDQVSYNDFLKGQLENQSKGIEEQKQLITKALLMVSDMADKASFHSTAMFWSAILVAISCAGMAFKIIGI